MEGEERKGGVREGVGLKGRREGVGVGAHSVWMINASGLKLRSIKTSSTGGSLRITVIYAARYVAHTH